MLTEKEIHDNKIRYISLLRGTNREGVEDLIEYMDKHSDFFEAPASTKYHGNFKGGLCAHCLHVYDILEDLVNKHDVDHMIPNDSVVISALLHDMQKMDHYEPTIFNKKVYSPHGTKSDSLGKFDWESVHGYKTRDEENRFIYGNHEETCEYIARQFVPLTAEESVSILHHMGGLGYDSIKEGLNEVFKRYPLALFLHVADSIASQVYC